MQDLVPCGSNSAQCDSIDVCVSPTRRQAKDEGGFATSVPLPPTGCNIARSVTKPLTQNGGGHIGFCTGDDTANCWQMGLGESVSTELHVLEGEPRQSQNTWAIDREKPVSSVLGLFSTTAGGAASRCSQTDVVCKILDLSPVHTRWVYTALHTLDAPQHHPLPLSP